MKDNFPGLPLNDNARCLAVHRVKARIIRDGFLKEGSIHQQQNIANKVVKFSTLMSEKMLSKIETKELQQFQKEMVDYCKLNGSEIRSSELLGNARRDSSQKEVKINHFLEQIKKSTKISLLRDKNRAKTHQKFDESLNIQSAKHSLKVRLPEKLKESSPLGNMKIKEALETTKRKNHPKSNFKLHGKGMNSHLVNLLEKLEEMQYIEKMRSRKEELGEDDPQEYILGPSSHLKKEKERLSTALEGQARSKFMPLGRMTKELRKVYEKQQMNISNEESQVSRLSNNRKVIHYEGRKQRKTEPSLHNSMKGKASFQLQEGLPTPVRQSAPYKGLAFRRQSLKNCVLSKDKVSGNSICRIFNVSRHNLDKTPLGYQQ